MNSNRQRALRLDAKDDGMNCTSEIADYMPLDDDSLHKFSQT